MASTESPLQQVDQNTQPAGPALVEVKEQHVEALDAVENDPVGRKSEPESPAVDVAPAAEAPAVVPPPAASGVWARAPPADGSKLVVPISNPEAGSQPGPAPATTEKEDKMYGELLEHVSCWTGVPLTEASTKKTHHSRDHGGDGAALDPLTDADRMFMSKQCLLRYLRAVRYSSVDEAARRVMMTLTWRREYGLPFSADHISPENETGKQWFIGFDKQARPVLVLNPSKQNTKLSARQNQHLVYMLESVLSSLPAGQETLTLIVNFKGVKPTGGVPLSQAKEILHILQYHYPERLGTALVKDAPWYIKVFLDLVIPFIDPRTKAKISVNANLLEHIPEAQLPTEFGGKLKFEYDHSAYWPALEQLVKHRNELHRYRWEQLGKKIGEDEGKILGGEK